MSQSILTQIGITPWAKRSLTYLCVLEAPPSVQAQQLLTRMLQALHWPQEEGSTLCFPQQSAKISVLAPAIVLSFGEMPTLAALIKEATLVTLPPLDQLLHSADAKKNAWKLLQPYARLPSK